MIEEAKRRTAALQGRMKEQGIEVAVFTDESSIAYLAGFWGYLGVEFGRPTLLVVRLAEAPVVITPLLEAEMVSAMTWVEDVRVWEDSGARSWAQALGEVLGAEEDAIWIEKQAIPALVRNYLDEAYPAAALHDIAPLLADMRTVKSPLEIEVMKQAGKIAGAMMKAAHESLAEGAMEYQSALAAMEAGTEAAAGFLTDKGWERFVSPLIHNLQILQSGPETSMVHRRAGLRGYRRGDPVYFCFCNMAQFKQYKLGFDRTFHIGEVSDEAAEVQRCAIDAQQAALSVMRAGVPAEEVAEAANEVYRARGYETGYRTGRSIGMAYLEAPELKVGDNTLLRAGMTFAVDGGISIEGRLGGRIGDSVVVTDTGFEYLTDYPRELLVTER